MCHSNCPVSVAQCANSKSHIATKGWVYSGHPGAVWCSVGLCGAFCHSVIGVLSYIMHNAAMWCSVLQCGECVTFLYCYVVLYGKMWRHTVFNFVVLGFVVYYCVDSLDPV